MYFEDRDERELFDYDSALKLEDLNGTTNRKILNLIKATKSYNEGILAGSDIKKSQTKKVEGPSDEKKNTNTIKMMKGKGKAQSNFRPTGDDQDHIQEEDENDSSNNSKSDEENNDDDSENSRPKSKTKVVRSRSESQASSRKSQGGPGKDKDDSLSKNESNPSLDESNIKPKPKQERDPIMKGSKFLGIKPRERAGDGSQRAILPPNKPNMLSPNINHGGKHLLVPPVHAQRNSATN